MESCSVDGDHRIISLKCGHLFGKNCVETWLKVYFSIDN